MPILRHQPYNQFNFQVNLGAPANGAEGGFNEVCLPESRLETIEYRQGNDKLNSPRRLTGLERTTNLVLRRGVMGSTLLYEWFNATRNGEPNAARNVTVQLLSEDRASVVQTWKFLNARPAAIGWGPLRANAKEVALEYLELSFERLELE